MGEYYHCWLKPVVLKWQASKFISSKYYLYFVFLLWRKWVQGKKGIKGNIKGIIKYQKLDDQVYFSVLCTALKNYQIIITGE